jgi:hypothetical protein
MSNCDLCSNKATVHLCDEHAAEVEDAYDELKALREALEPFAALGHVMWPGQHLTYRGVYVSYEQAKAAEKALRDT